MIGHNLPRARGTFAKVEAVPTRGVYKFIVEVPDEQADAALSALGGLPAGGDARWVSIALLEQETPSAPAPAPQPERRPFHKLPPSTQAGIRCGERSFWTFLAKSLPALWNELRPARRPDLALTDQQAEELAAAVVRRYCGVTSRSELDKNDSARAKWAELDRCYSVETGREAEPR